MAAPRGGADPDARPEPATLVVRVESAFALELQHLAPLLIERINAHYGWRCVGRLVLKQGPVRAAQAGAPARRRSFVRGAERRGVAETTARHRGGRRCARRSTRLGSAVVADGAAHEGVSRRALATFRREVLTETATDRPVPEDRIHDHPPRALVLLGSAAAGGRRSCRACPALAQNVSPDELAAPGPLGDVALGPADAKVTIVEYASLTCSHCAAFHEDT